MACYKEAIWKLSILFFGDNPYGRNNSLGLKRLMSKLTPDPRMGMDKYKRCMAELNSYLPFTLCEAAYKKSNKEQPSMLREDELRDKLCDNLNIHQRMYCKQHNHNWFEESYARTIATLTLGEPQIIDAMDKSKENAKAAKASKLSGSKRKTDASNSNGNGNNKKTKCPHCHKFHKGLCRLKGKPGDKTLQGNKKDVDVNQLAAKVAEHLNSMQSQQSKPGWASTMEDAKYETICALYRAAHDMDPEERVEDMNSSDLNHYSHIYQVSRSANFK